MSAPEKLVAVEYFGGHPHSVITTTNGNGWTVWDFDWCKRDQTVYYHQSGGCGAQGVYAVGTLVRGRAELWVDASIHAFQDYRGKPLTRRQVGRHGYDLLADHKGDPFAGAVESATTGCTSCDDRLPDERQCRHLVYVAGEGLLGCGSSEYQAEYHLESLQKLFLVLGRELVERLMKELVAGGARWECSCPGGEADQLALRDPVTRKDVALDGDRAAAAGVEWDDLFVGMAWLSSLEPGKTKKAIKLTVRWMRAWLRRSAR